MKLKAGGISIGRWLSLIVLALTTAILLFQLFFQRYFMTYVESIHRTNMDVVMEQISSGVQDTFTTMAAAVTYLSTSNVVREYVKTEELTARYQKAYSDVKPIVSSATQNLGFKNVLITNSAGDWHEFTDNLLLTSQARLFVERFTGNQHISNIEVTNTIVFLGDTPYFCSYHPILDLPDIERLGLVLALTDMDDPRRLLNSYGDRQGITICLHDFDTVLVSNVQELENLPVDQAALQGGDMLYREDTILPGSLGVIVSTPLSGLFPQRTTFMFILLTVGGFTLLMILLLALFTNRLLVRPITQVIGETRQLGDGDLSRRLSKTGVSQLDALVASINEMLARLEDYSRRVFATQQNLYEMELDQRETQLYLLRNQIDRHFLYNSLISIRSLADRREGEKVKEVASGIAQLLRYTTSRVQEVNLFDEMEVVQRYVSIQNIRFGDIITLDIDVDDQLCAYKILKLLVQPLVENALVHGLEATRHSGCILSLRGSLVASGESGYVGSLPGTGIRIEVEDNGVGIPADQLRRIQRNIHDMENTDSRHELEGIALVNIQKRISIAYGGSYGLQVESEEGCFTRAILTLPAIPDTLAN